MKIYLIGCVRTLSVRLTSLIDEKKLGKTAGSFRPVCTQLFIDPGDQFGTAHTAVMPWFLSPFVGTPLCALRTITFFCRACVAAQLPGNSAVTPACEKNTYFPEII